MHKQEQLQRPRNKTPNAQEGVRKHTGLDIQFHAWVRITSEVVIEQTMGSNKRTCNRSSEQAVSQSVKQASKQTNNWAHTQNIRSTNAASILTLDTRPDINFTNMQIHTKRQTSHHNISSTPHVVPVASFACSTSFALYSEGMEQWMQCHSKCPSTLPCRFVCSANPGKCDNMQSKRHQIPCSKKKWRTKTPAQIQNNKQVESRYCTKSSGEN